jgi:hypothetical protein
VILSRSIQDILPFPDTILYTFIMSNQLMSSKNELFTPRDLVTTPVEGKSFLRLYPKRNIGDIWSELETNLAFNVNCSTLQNSNLKKNVIIETLAEQMGTSTQMHIYLQRYDSLGKFQFYDPTKLKVLSYHNKKGAVIEEAMRYVAGVETLQDLALRPQGIHFVKLRCNLDFSSLGVPASSNSAIDFYACLPITANDAIAPAVENDIPTIDQLNALRDELATARTALENAEGDQRVAAEQAVTTARNAFNSAQDLRNTGVAAATARANGANFNGPSSWLSDLTSSEELSTFLSSDGGPSPLLTPFLLSKPAFDSNIAKMDTKSFKDQFDTLVIELAYEPLKKVIFDYVCPSIKNEPFQLFQAVCQETPDPEDPNKRIKISVQQYADIFNGLMRSLSSDSEWLVDVHEYFMKNLASDIREKMESNGYNVHMQSSSKLPFNQIKLMENARKQALHAEKSLNSQAKMIQTQLQNNHGFYANLGQAHFSPAERTMNHYKKDEFNPDFKRPSVVCWGCKKNTHRWYDKVLKKVVCPDGNNPAYIKAAALAKKEFNQKVRDRAARLRAKQDQDPATKQKRRLLEALLGSDTNLIIQGSQDDTTLNSLISGNTSTTRNITLNLDQPSASNNNNTNDESDPSPTKKVKFSSGCFNLITCALNATNGKELLPIALHPALPHIRLQLGEPDSDFNPALLGIIDTGATLTVGYSEYVLGIAESYPHLVKSIIWAEDKYCPIELSGVGSDSNNKGSNTLSAVVTFHMPYLTTNNHSTSLSIAIGTNVAVNILLGMSFINNAQLVIDSADKVAEAKMLQCKPFEIIFKHVSRGKPNKIPTDFQPDKAVFAATLRRIKATREYVKGTNTVYTPNEKGTLTTAINSNGLPEVSLHNAPGEVSKSITYAFEDESN